MPTSQDTLQITPESSLSSPVEDTPVSPEQLTRSLEVPSSYIQQLVGKVEQAYAPQATAASTTEAKKAVAPLETAHIAVQIGATLEQLRAQEVQKDMRRFN